MGYVSSLEGNPPGKLQDGKGPLLKYEGLMADRRIGGTDRESYVRGTQKNGSRSPGLRVGPGTSTGRMMQHGKMESRNPLTWSDSLRQ